MMILLFCLHRVNVGSVAEFSGVYATSLSPETPLPSNFLMVSYVVIFPS
jgi:hypothetical protein